MPKHLPFEVGEKKQVNFYYSKSRYEQFQRIHPNLVSWFLCHCFDTALENPDFVSKVCCGDYKK